jgi:4-diphosphocytidyl-2-C-methyl-D-erythritol kinase
VIRALACAKINLSLRVAARQANGLHRIDGLFQSISWMDRLEVALSAEDTLRSGGGGEVIAGWDNLAWRAVEEVRGITGGTRGIELVLDKAIPAAAGLGGGSADSAAALAVAGHLLGLEREALVAVTARLGSDVPFCFTGGTAEVSGTGEGLHTRQPATGFAIAAVVPPVELATGTVYSTWDELGGPKGEAPPDSALPPALRGEGPLANDLLPAALAVSPALGDWRSELVARWSRPVLLTGSGPTLFAFFVDEAEAAAAIEDTPPGARGTAATIPLPFGWAFRDAGGPVVSSAPVDSSTTRLIASILDAGT